MVQMGLNQNFVRVKEDDTDKEYLEWRQTEDGEINEIEDFDANLVKGYHGDTISCMTKTVYDIYRVYDKGELILESEDEVIELWREYETTMEIRAYDRSGDKLILRGICKYVGIEKQIPHDPDLSVIVPLYNSELFMCRTIDSILASRFGGNLELILIDDGSTDKSYEIAKRYEDNYPCVRAYTQNNHGVSETRNRGLDLANGEFVAFCDNDDIVHPYMYGILYNACMEEKSDIAIAQTLIRKGMDDKERYLSCRKHSDKDTVVYSFEELVENRLTPGNIYFVAVWNKIVRTEVARKAKFPTKYQGVGILYEDVAYTGSLYSYIDKFVYCRNAIYTRDKRKQKTVGTASTWHKSIDNELVWKMFIYGFSYPLYNKSGRHLLHHDYTHFKRLIESYDKFKTESPLKTYWDEQLTELIKTQKLNENKKIMNDEHLREVVNNLIPNQL